jgi:hypothetical protein
VGWVLGFWFVMFLGYLVLLWIEYRLASDSLSCPIPGQESASAFGQPSWQWFPPGKVCSYPGTELPTDYPSTDRAWIGAFLVAVPVVVVALWIWSEVRIRDRLRVAA